MNFQAKPLLIRNVSMIDGYSDEIVDNQNILIENGIISRIWKEEVEEIPGIDNIHADNQFVIPGLIDSHTHLFPGSFNLFLSQGVTSVRDMASISDWTIEQRRKAEVGDVCGPRIYTHGELIDGMTSRRKDAPYTICVRDENEIVAAINRLEIKRVDAIKLYSELPIGIFKRGVQHAHEIGLSVSAHVGHSRRVTVKQAVEEGVDAIEHTATLLPDLFSMDELAETMKNTHMVKNQLRGYIAWSKVNLQNQRVRHIVSLLAEKRIYHTPTLINIENLIEGESSIGDNERLLLKQVSEEITANWRQLTPSLYEDWSTEEGKIATEGFGKIKQLVGELYKAGVRLGVGSDAPNPWTIPGHALIREMELLVECGIPPMKVIQLATKSAADALGEKFKDIGRIKEGKLSDLIILKENPVTNISNCRKVSHVIRRGMLYNPAS